MSGLALHGGKSAINLIIFKKIEFIYRNFYYVRRLSPKNGFRYQNYQKCLGIKKFYKKFDRQICSFNFICCYAVNSSETLKIDRHTLLILIS